MKFRWSTAPAQPELAQNLSADARLSPLLAQCLLNRGLNEPHCTTAFLRPRLKMLADPFLLPNMEAAVQRLLVARDNKEPLVIFGDYDVDGVTSTALLMEVFTALGWKADFYLPHRLDEGYGLSQDGVENCSKKFPAKLLLAVDCGSTANTSIAWLKEQGIDVLVLDHHQVSTPHPPAVAVVNPQLAAEDAPNFRELCSAGLAFKLAHALVKRGRELGWPDAHEFDLRPLLDLVALGTIADLVPLTGENRILTKIGLEYLNQSKRPGIVALRNVAQSGNTVGCYEVGFQLAPRLNAAGRLENAEEALQLLLAREFALAEPIAQSLDARNRQRQEIERAISEQAIGAVRARFDPQNDFVIVEGQLLWHVGVVGIVASRVLHEFYRPTIIIGGEGNSWRGSGRSIEGFDLAAALRECDDLLVKHGGHAMAAGLTIDPKNLEAFRQRLNDIARRTLKREQLQPVLRLDAEVELSNLTFQSVQELESLQPIGQKNPPVHLWAHGLTHQRTPQRMGKENQHAKLWVGNGGKIFEAVWWNCGAAPLPKIRFDLAFAPQINEFNGNSSVQLKILDWRPCD
ncbi:MAG: single-stranded-DNA-specific exonuclease RecJ [Verrucomicrobiota bacterium]